MGNYETHKSEPQYFLWSQAESESEENIDKNIDENIEEMEMDLQTDLNYDFDTEDFQRASFDNALDVIKGKIRPEYIAKWPNDTLWN